MEDYDDNDSQNHLGDDKFPPVLQPYALPKFDFDDNINTHLRFDHLVGTEVYLGNEDSNWIEDFSRASATDSCAISRHNNNVWSEATSTESVEMLLNSVGQDQLIVAEQHTSINKQMEPHKIPNPGDSSLLGPEHILLKQDDSLLDSSPLESDSQPEQILVKEDDSPTVAQELSMEEKDSHIFKPVGTAGHEDIQTEMTDSLLDQVEDEEAKEESRMENDSIDTTVQNVVTCSDELNNHNTLLPQTLGDENDNGDDLAVDARSEVLEHHSDSHVDSASVVENAEAKTMGETAEPDLKEMEQSDVAIVEREDRVQSRDDLTVYAQSVVVEATSDSHVDSASEAENVEAKTLDKTPEPDCKEMELSDVAILERGDHIQSRDDLTVYGQSVVEAASDSHVDSASETENVEAKTLDKTPEPDCKEMKLSNVAILERGDQALSSLEVGGQDDLGTQCPDPLFSVLHTSAIVEPSSEVAGELSTLTSRSAVEKHELRSHQHIEVSASTLQTEINTHIHLVETSESVFVSHMDSIDESTQSGVFEKTGNSESNDRICILNQNVELAVNENDSRDEDAKSSQILSETVVSESVGYLSGGSGSSSKLLESKSHPDTIPTDKSWTMIDGKECESVPLIPEELQHPSQDGAPAVSLATSMVEVSSDANEEIRFSENKKVSSPQPEICHTVPHVDSSGSGSQMNQQATKHTEDSQKSTQFFGDCSASEGSKDADPAEQDMLQQSEEIILAENLLPEGVNAPETLTNLEKDAIGEKANTAGKDGREEENTAAASGGFVKAGTPVSDHKGEALETGDAHASTSSEHSVKPHATVTDNTATDLGGSLVSFIDIKTSEVPLDKTETNNGKKSEDQSISGFMSAISPILDRNEPSSSGMDLTPNPQKVEELSKAVNLPQATVVSPIVMGSPPTSNIEETPTKPSKTKSERKPRGTSKSTGNATSRQGNGAKGATPFQITHSTEKQQSLQNAALNAFGTLSTPTASLPDLKSSALSCILGRPFTDLQQVQLRSQIFVYGALIQGTAPDEAYMISAFGGPDGGKGSWDKAWRACITRAHKLRSATPETPLQPRAGKRETPLTGHTSIKEGSATNLPIPLSSPLWSLSTSFDTLQSSSIQSSTTTPHQPMPLPSSSHAHQTLPTTNIVGHTPWMSPLPYRSPWLASPRMSGFDVPRFPVLPITEPVKLTPLSLSYSDVKLVQSGSSSNAFKGTPKIEPSSTVVAPTQHLTESKSRKRKKLPVSVDSGPSILNSLKQTELAASPLVSASQSMPITTAPANLTFNAGSTVSTTPVPMNISKFPEMNVKSSVPSPIFGGNHLSGVEQRSVLSEDIIDKLKEATMHAEDASALATAAVSHSEYVWKQIEKQRHSILNPETQGRLASAAVAVAAAAAVAKAAAAAASVAANAALQAKLMAEEASLPSFSDQVNEIPKSNDNMILGQGTPASTLKGEGTVVRSSSLLTAARETSKKRVEAATAATKRAENMDSIVKAAELASEAVSQAGILVSMGHPPLLNKLVEAGPSNYWRQAQESQEKAVTVSDGAFASPRTVHTELGGSVRMSNVVNGTASATGNKTKGQKSQKGADLDRSDAIVFEPEAGSKSSIDTQTESEQVTKTPNDEKIREGSNVEVFKEGDGLRTAWYFANVLSLEDDKAYVVFNDLSVEEGKDKLKEWVALKGEYDEAPRIRNARSVTDMPYKGTRKRRRAAIGDPIWKIGDRVDSWIHDSWWEGVITEKNKNDENTVTVHFPAEGDTLTVKSWNLRPSLVWKDGKWIECSSSGENCSSSHEGDTPKEKRPRLESPALAAQEKDTSMPQTADDPDLGKLPQTSGVLDLGISENMFNIGRSTIREEDKPYPLRMKRTGLQKQGSKVIYGVPKPGKKRKFMDVSKHYVSEGSSKTREPAKPPPLKSIVPPQGSWRMPSRTISRDNNKQTTLSKSKTFKPAAPKSKEKLPGAGVSGRTIPRKDSRSTNIESDVTADPASGTREEQTTTSSSSSINKGKVASTAGRLAKIEEDKTLPEGLEPRRSVRRIQPTSRLLEGLQTSMMTSKIPSVSHNKNQSRK